MPRYVDNNIIPLHAHSSIENYVGWLRAQCELVDVDADEIRRVQSYKALSTRSVRVSCIFPFVAVVGLIVALDDDCAHAKDTAYGPCRHFKGGRRCKCLHSVEVGPDITKLIDLPQFLHLREMVLAQEEQAHAASRVRRGY